MTEPTTLNESFDTSLVDVHGSFSSTETNTSGSSAKDNSTQSVPESSYRQCNVSTHELYQQWACTYDTDGNVLQAVDDLQMRDMIPEFVRTLCHPPVSNPAINQGVVKILDLGCGTGRNLLKLVEAASSCEMDIVAWDASQAMLNSARQKCVQATRHLREVTSVKLDLRLIDFAAVDSVPAEAISAFNGVISTLVLEHLPLETFLAVLSKVLRPGGLALVSNMHPDMGRSTQAGFKNQEGERVSGVSYAHGVEQTADAAKGYGLELVGDIKEATVSDMMIEHGLVREGARKWVGRKIWYGLLLRRK